MCCNSWGCKESDTTVLLNWTKLNVIDYFVCDAAPLLKISCPETWLIEQRIIVCAAWPLSWPLCVSFYYIYMYIYIYIYIYTYTHTHTHIYIYNQDHFTISFFPTKEKGIFYMFFPLYFDFHHLWKLYFIYVKPSAK